MAIIGELGSRQTLWRGTDPELALLDYYALGTTLLLEGIDFSGEGGAVHFAGWAWFGSLSKSL